MNKLTVFITGAKGFIGKEVVAQCIKKDIHVIGVDLFPGNDDKIHKAGFDYLQADICSKEIVNIIPEGVDAIIHLAGLARDPDCRDKAYACFDANVMATLNLIDAAVAKKAKQFIFASTEWIYGESRDYALKNEESIIDISKLVSEYALSKIVSEANLRQKFNRGFCSTTILRFGITYGPKEKNFAAVESIFNEVKTKDVVKVGSFKTGRHFIHASDLAKGIIASIGLQGLNVINLVSDKLVTLGDVIEVSKKVLARNPETLESDPANFNVRTVSNEKAKKILHWKPELSLEDGLRTLL